MRKTDGQRPVLVVGGGLGGLALGVALGRAGIPYQILERAPVVASSRLGMMLAGNGYEALASLGLESSLHAVGVALDKAQIHAAGGSCLIDVPMASFSSLYGSSVLGMPRRALHGALLDALPEGAVRMGADVRDVSVRTDGVEVELASGERLAGSVLVGADGLASRVSELLHPGAGPAPIGVVLYRGQSEREASVPGCISMWLADQAQFGDFPVEGGGASWWVSLRATEDCGVWRLRKVEEVAALVEPLEPELAKLVASTPQQHFRRVVPRVQVPGGLWGRDCATLIGDAAHAIAPGLGQGGSQAIIDGVVLARTMKEHGTTPEALRLFERQRSREVRWYGLQARRTMEAFMVPAERIPDTTRALQRLLPTQDGDREARMLHSFKG